MSIGQKNNDGDWEKSGVIHEDDPQALEKLTARLAILESEVPPNRRRINYVKKRIKYIQRINRMQHEEYGFPGGMLITNEETNRIEFSFLWPPDKEVEDKLRQRGFRQWSIYLWQAPRNPKYLQRAHRILACLIEPYTEPDFEKIPVLRAEMLLFYLKAIREALGPEVEEKTVQKGTQRVSIVASSQESPATEPEPECPAAEQVLETPMVRPKKQTPSFDLKTIRERVKAMPGTELTVKGITSPLVWVSGDTKPYKEELKALGGRWSPKKTAWYIKPNMSKSTKE